MPGWGVETGVDLSMSGNIAGEVAGGKTVTGGEGSMDMMQTMILIGEGDE